MRPPAAYARQDKFWVQGAPDGEAWEIYTVLADSQTFYGEGHRTECCGGTGQRVVGTSRFPRRDDLLLAGAPGGHGRAGMRKERHHDIGN